MFRTISSTVDPIDCVQEKQQDVNETEDTRSCAPTEDDIEAVERVSSRDEIEENEKSTPSRPQSLKRTTSHALSRVGSRMTTHSITDPGPAPDGGLKAWTQIAMGWLAIFTTWGWINCFGIRPSIVCSEDPY